METRKIQAKIGIETNEITIIKEQLVLARKKWEEIVINRQNIRGKEILDLHNKQYVESDDPKIK